MMRRVCVVDTNIVVSGLIGSRSGPPARMLRAMLGGGVPYFTTFVRSPIVSDRPAHAMGRSALRKWAWALFEGWAPGKGLPVMRRYNPPPDATRRTALGRRLAGERTRAGQTNRKTGMPGDGGHGEEDEKDIQEIQPTRGPA